MLKGLRDAGIDLTQADLIVGTSAGAIVGTRILAGRPLDEFYDAQLAAPTRASSAESPRIDREYFQETSRLYRRPETSQAQRIEVGQRAVAATQVIPEEEWVEYMAASLGVPDWPSARLEITAVDVFDGTTRLINQTQGVPIERAVAASTALPGRDAPITIGDQRYMDGGVGGTHLDAAASYRLVVALTPAGPATEREIEQLRGQGSQVMIVAPDAESRAALGPNSLDVTRRRVSAEAGLRQAATVAADLNNSWNGTAPSH
jgi:NTE family protein